MTRTERTQVFVSYSHQDAEHLKRLQVHLKQLEREGKVDAWDDTRILAGADWRAEIDAALTKAKVAVLLITADFLASDFIANEELPAILAAQASEGLVVLPVLLKPSRFKQTPSLSRFQAVNPRLVPLIDLGEGDREALWVKVTQDIERALNPPSSTPGPGAAAAPSPTPDRPPHNLPFDSLGSLFKGRDEALAELHEALAGDDGDAATAIVQKQAISGLGGIGKTRLAVEYAWRYAPEYTALLFVGADAPASLRANLAALSGPHALNLREQAATEEDAQVAAVLRWLADHDDWLLILDNVDSDAAADAVLPLLPQLGRGRVLITTRRALWGATVKRHTLGKIAHDQATRFLLERTADDRQRAPDDEAQAGSLADLLDGLALGLELAAARIAHDHLAFADYLAKWATEREKMLGWNVERETGYPDPIAIAWQSSFDQLGPAPRAVLNLCAWLAPDPIPAGMFEEHGDIVAEAVGLLCAETDEQAPGVDVSEALADLAAYCLITWGEGRAFTVHRMLQEVVRTRVREAHRRDWLKKALRLVDAHTPFDADDVRTWCVMDLVRPHAARIVSDADQAGITEPTAGLMNQVAVFLQAKALYTEAEPLMRRALEIDEAAFGPEHHEVARDLNNLAQLLQATNRLDEAEPLMRRALDIDQAAFGGEHPNVAPNLNNLALLLQATNRLDEAEPLMRRALDIDEAAFGSEHPNVATYLNNLAQLLQATNRLDEAEPLMRRALEIDEAAFGPQHPNVARDLNNLALLLQDTNRLDEAEPLMRRVIEIFERAYGQTHPNVATAVNNLASLLYATNRLDEAEPLMRRALDIDEAAFGPEHPKVPIRLNNLAQLLKATNRLDDAVPLYRRALAICEASLGSDHPNTVMVRENLDSLLEEMGR